MSVDSVDEPHLHEASQGHLQGVLASPRHLGLSIVVVVLLSLMGWVAIGFAARFLIN